MLPPTLVGPFLADTSVGRTHIKPTSRRRRPQPVTAGQVASFPCRGQPFVYGWGTRVRCHLARGLWAATSAIVVYLSGMRSSMGRRRCVRIRPGPARRSVSAFVKAICDSSLTSKSVRRRGSQASGLNLSGGRRAMFSGRAPMRHESRSDCRRGRPRVLQSASASRPLVLWLGSFLEARRGSGPHRRYQ